MSRHKKYHDWELPKMLEAYADERGVDYARLSPFHSRISYQRVVVDIWTTRKYWVKETNYEHGLVERGGEKGILPHGKTATCEFLDKILFAVEIAEAA